MNTTLDDHTSSSSSSSSHSSAGVVGDDAAHIRNALEVDRLSRELAERFDVARDFIESRVQVEFRRWSSAPIQDFVPIFVERTIRGSIRSHAI